MSEPGSPTSFDEADLIRELTRQAREAVEEASGGPPPWPMKPIEKAHGSDHFFDLRFVHGPPAMTIEWDSAGSKTWKEAVFDVSRNI